MSPDCFVILWVGKCWLCQTNQVLDTALLLAKGHQLPFFSGKGYLKSGSIKSGSIEWFIKQNFIISVLT